MYTRRKGCRLFAVTTAQIDKMYDVPEQLSAIVRQPAELKKYTDVFPLKEDEKVPSCCVSEHHISLMKDKTAPFEPLYTMSREELKTLWQRLVEELWKGFTRSSSLAVASSVLFAKKKDGSPCFCVYYHALHKSTVEGLHSLPLTRETLNNLSRMK